MCRDATKGTLRDSAGHFGTKIMYLAQFLPELLRILSFKTSLMKN